MAYFFKDDKAKVEVRVLTGQLTVPANQTSYELQVSEEAMELTPISRLAVLSCSVSEKPSGGYNYYYEFAGGYYLDTAGIYGWNNPNTSNKNFFRVYFKNTSSRERVYVYKIVYMITDGN